MKKLILNFSCCVLSVCFANSQPTITSANIFVIGDVLTAQGSDTSAVEGPAGINQVWNFSSIPAVGAAMQTEVVTPSSTPYGASFPTANISTQDMTGQDAYAYLKTTSTDMQLVGFAAGGDEYPLADFQTEFVYPFTYNTMFIDNSSGNWVINTVPIDRDAVNTFHADAYGTLQLPSGTFTDVLRVKYVQEVTDVSTIYQTTITTVTVITSYSWYKSGIKDPLMSINYTDVTVFGYTQHGKGVSYYPGTVSTNDLQPAVVALNCFPNPAKDHATLSFTMDEAGDATISIINIAGQQVKSFEEKSFSAEKHAEELNLNDLADGVYFIRLEMMNRKTATIRLIKG